MNLELLRLEILTDPLLRGYSGMSDQEVADSLNDTNRSYNRAVMSGREIGNQVDQTEYEALTSDEKSLLFQLLNMNSLDPYGFAQIALSDLFPNGSTTLSNLAAVRSGRMSRGAEIGFGKVKVGHVIDARKV